MKSIFSNEAVKPWSRLPREAVQFLTILGDFQYPAAKSPEQTGLTPQLILLGEGGWTRDLRSSLQA